jgi:hypothetical protein
VRRVIRERVKVVGERLRPLMTVGMIAGGLALIPYPTCLVKLALGVPCPGCGMTRATLRLLHGDVHGSVQFHPLALPGALAVLVAMVIAAWLPPGHPAWDRFVGRAMTVASVGLAGVWILRMVHVLPWV